MTLKPVNSLRAMQAGTISVSMTGDEVAISLARALNLDVDGYQVRTPASHPNPNFIAK
jgi:hypothetical protein